MIEARGMHPDKYPHRDGVALSNACLVFRSGVRESFAGTPDPLGCVRNVPGYLARRLIAADGGRLLRVIVRTPEGFVVLGEQVPEDEIRAEFLGSAEEAPAEPASGADADGAVDEPEASVDGERDTVPPDGTVDADSAGESESAGENAGAFVPSAESFLALTKAGLVELAEAHGIEIDESARKDEIRAVVAAALGLDLGGSVE